MSVCSPEQKENGVLVIDLGGGTTDYFVYANRMVALAGTLGVGGEHCTNDLAMGMGLPTAQAEWLKREAGSAMIDLGHRNKKISIPPDGGFPGATVYARDVQTILNARMEETFQLVKTELSRRNLLPILGAGVLLTGGGAHMRKVQDLGEKVFGVRCARGLPRNVGGLAVATQGPEYAATTGMLKYAFRTERKPTGNGPFGSIFRGLFQKGGGA